MTKREELESRARRAIFQNALFRWETAALISLTMLLTSLDAGFDMIPFVPWWAWLLGGLAATGGFLWSAVTDPNTAGKAVADMLLEKFNPGALEDEELQGKVQEALHYHRQLIRAIEERGDSLIGDELRQTAVMMDEWIEEIYTLAKRIDTYQRQEKLLGNRFERAKYQLQQLRIQLDHEDNPRVQQDIEANIESLEYQIKTLGQIDDTMQRARLMLSNKLTSMETIYLQSVLAGAKEIDSGKAKRLKHEISEEVQEMDDILVALDEVYAGSE